jgi:hypothetical protein
MAHAGILGSQQYEKRWKKGNSQVLDIQPEAYLREVIGLQFKGIATGIKAQTCHYTAVCQCTG